MTKIVSRDKFWELMCKSSFIRLAERKGVIGRETYYCYNPPNMQYVLKKMKEVLL